MLVVDDESDVREPVGTALIERGLYADWIDHGRQRPTHRQWSAYLRAPRSRPRTVSSGSGITIALATVRNWSIAIPGIAIWGGLAAALTIGGLAGLYPAIRASRLAPTDALRAV